MKLKNFVWTLLLVLFAVSTAFGATSLRSGASKGFAVTKEGKNSTTFQDKKKRDVLRINGEVYTAWKRGKLGPCFLHEPVWQVQHARTKEPGRIYRFRDGIVLVYSGRTFFQPREIADPWWPESGLVRTDKK